MRGLRFNLIAQARRYLILKGAHLSFHLGHDRAWRSPEQEDYYRYNMWEAQQVCDLIGVLDKGKMVAIGTPDEIRRMVGEKVVLSLTLGGSSIFNETRAPLLVREVTKVHGVANVSLNDNGRVFVDACDIVRDCSGMPV